MCGDGEVIRDDTKNFIMDFSVYLGSGQATGRKEEQWCMGSGIVKKEDIKSC